MLNRTLELWSADKLHIPNPVKPLSPQEQGSIASLKRNKEIVVLPADKGSAIVLLDRVDYDKKMMDLLSDNKTYIEVQSRATKDLANQINKELAKLKRLNHLSDEHTKQLRAGEDPTPRIYGLPKVHKESVPLRPVVSCQSSPNYKLAKFLHGILRPCLQTGGTTVKSSNDFLMKLNNIDIKNDEIMVSFDITSLFTNISTNFAKKCIERLLDSTEEWKARTKLSKTELLRLIEFCMQTFFQFKGKTYRQIQGTPMGSPLSGFLADVVMEEFENLAFVSFRPKTWLRYVDDTFVILPKHKVEDFHNTINNVMENITFTYEVEANLSLPFLDILVTRTSTGALETSVYRKPTTTDIILNFKSNHPVSHLRSCVRTLFRRVDTHCNTQRAKREERIHLFRLFEVNGYPKCFINSCLRRTRCTQQGLKESKKMVVLPYIRGTSELSERLLKPFGWTVAHKPTATLRSTISLVKDPVPEMEKSGVVYSIPCQQCDQAYVGETGKQLCTRLKEHRLALRRADPKSQLWNHCATTGHEIQFAEAKVIGRAKGKAERLVMEAVHSRNTLNRHVDLDSHYNAIANQVTTRRERKSERTN